CSSDDVVFLTEGKSLKLPAFAVPKWLHNVGNRIVSVNRLVKWLAEKVEEKGAQVFPEFPAAELLLDDSRVVGVRTGDKGVDRNGARKANYEPGMDVRAKVTILAEGARGSLTKRLVKTLGLDRDKNPQVYATGVKEVWKVEGCDARSK